MRMNIKSKLLLMLLLFTTLIAGCMVGPDYLRPKTAADTDGGFYYAGEHIQDINEIERADRWWESFGDDITVELVKRALKNNYNLKAAAARVLQSQKVLDQASGTLWPQVSYDISRTKSKTSVNFGPFGRQSFYSKQYNHSISVIYTLDFFGKLRRMKRASWADFLASEANTKALINTTIATVVEARIDIAVLKRRIEIAENNIRSQKITLEIVERRYEQGRVGPVDVRLARENLESSQSMLITLQLSLKRSLFALDVLLGQRPGTTKELPNTLAQLPNPEPVMIGLPGILLDRRPDVIAAEASLRAANERIGVSIAQLYPDLTITGSLGMTGDTSKNLLNDDFEIYNLVMQAAQPLFKGGQLFAKVGESEARFVELAANYSNTVLNALREVEDALVSEQMLQVQLKHVELRVQEALAAENLSRDRYQRGIEEILTVLDSERRRINSEDELAQLRGSIWTTRVNLYLALGGDWVAGDKEQERIK